MAYSMIIFIVVFLYLFVFNTIRSDQICDRRTTEQQQQPQPNYKAYTNINDIDMRGLSNIYTPAEVDDMDTLWIGWPRYQYKATHSATKVVLNMIKELCGAKNDNNNIASTRIMVQVPADIYNDSLAILIAEGLANCVQFNFEARDDIWIRDMGPVFTYYAESLYGIDFDFDFWSGAEHGGQNFTIFEESLDRLIYYNGNQTAAIINTCLVGEGGNREFNGEDLLMMNQNVETLRNVGRNLYNTQWALEDSEREYKKLFNIDTIIWLSGIMSNDQIVTDPSYGPCDGCIAFGWGTGGHIDEIARFVSDDTIVILQITDVDIARDAYSNGKLEEDKVLMDANIEYLKANFEDLNVIRMPLAPSYWVQLTDEDDSYYWYVGLAEFDALVENDEIIYAYGATSYLNFVVTNQAVLIPKYYTKGDKYLGFKWIQRRDRKVLRIMKELFECTGREVIQINPVNINIGGGGMHCITAHQPSLVNAFLLDNDSDSSSADNALFIKDVGYKGYKKPEVVSATHFILVIPLMLLAFTFGCCVFIMENKNNVQLRQAIK